MERMTDQERADLCGEIIERVWRLVIDSEEDSDNCFRLTVLLSGYAAEEAARISHLPTPANAATNRELRARAKVLTARDRADHRPHHHLNHVVPRMRGQQ